MSTVRLSSYINFQGRAREALAFYQQVLGGTLSLPDAGERVALGRLEADGISILGSDGHPSYPTQVGENVALALSGADADKMGAIYAALATGGQAKAPLSPQPGGGQVGWLADQFGINWMLAVESE